MTTECPARTRQWVAVYRDAGLQPLPSDPTPHELGGRKKPLVRFAHLWTERAETDLFRKFPNANVQVMCGVFWGLCVLDLDGADAVRVVDTEWPRLPRSWVSWHSEGGRKSRHHWFRLPAHVRELRKRVVWADWGAKHSAIEILCDGSLVMAPPSVHPRTGREYGFARGCSPRDVPLATLPDWVLRLPALSPPAPERPPEPLPPMLPRRDPGKPGRKADARHVLDAIGDKSAVAAGWGLRIAGTRPSPEGWVSCHDFGRRDDHPSASFNLISGRFWRPGMGPRQTLSLFDLGAAIGGYPDWQACCSDLADAYGL